MTTQCKAFLIDPETQEISEVIYQGVYTDIYKHIGADCFDVARFNDKGDGVFVDDNGLAMEPNKFFLIRGNVNPLAGKGLVLGCDDKGDSVAPSKGVTLEWLKANVAFIEVIADGVIAVQAPGSMAGEVQSLFA